MIGTSYNGLFRGSCASIRETRDKSIPMSPVEM
jgi:hypothetical protein